MTVEVLNVLGAGDAFNGGFLSGWLRGEDYDACARYANACGALVVSRHGCAPAMPTRVELDYFIANADRIPRPDRDATLTRLHRVTAPRTPRDELCVFAFDHRNPFFALAQEAGADESRLPRLKRCWSRRWRRPPRRATSAAARACCATTATARTRSTPRPGAAGGSAGRSSCRAAIPSCSTAAARSARR